LASSSVISMNSSRRPPRLAEISDVLHPYHSFQVKVSSDRPPSSV